MSVDVLLVAGRSTNFVQLAPLYRALQGQGGLERIAKDLLSMVEK